MSQNKLRVFFIVGTLAVALLLVVGFTVSAVTQAPAYKEYRNASSVVIDGKNYLLVTNNSSVEIFSFNKASALVLESELRLPQKIKDVVTTNEGKDAYAFVTTGQFLYRVKISNPKKMEVVLKHDNYQYSRGKIRTGSVDLLATNGKYLFTGGQYGVRRMGLTNLQVEKYYFYEKTYGLAVNNQVLFIIGEKKAYNYHLSTNKKLMEINIKNVDKQFRQPGVNKQNVGFVISDNAIIKMINNQSTTYFNPTPKSNYSYAAFVSDRAIYYVNGLGVTKFDNNFKKTAFFNTANASRFGERSFAVGVLAVNVNGGEKVIVLNKSNILVLNNNLALISQYKNNNNLQNKPGFTINFDHIYFMTNEDITARMTGFYPNEIVKVKINGKFYQAKSSNLGEAIITFNTPSNPGRYVIEVKATSSATNYQTAREVK